MVDGEELPLTDTIRLFQPDPFPGGHRYRLIVPRSNLSQQFGIGPTSAPWVATQQSTMWAIESIAAALPGESAIPARYILNSVEVIRESNEGLEIEGLCSVPIAEP